MVARELGLPTIVGVSGGLMKRLKTGMKVRVDAGKGRLTIMSEEKAEVIGQVQEPSEDCPS